MLGLLIFLLLIIILILTFILLVRNREIKNITSEINNINTENSRRNIRLKAPSKVLGKLVKEINSLIEEKNDNIEAYKKKDIELRDSIANMSHDLRTPLTSIMGYIYLLEEEETTEEDKQIYLSIVKKRSEVLEKLIGDFYSLSRIQAEHYELELTEIVPADVLVEIIAAFYESIADKIGEPIIDIDEKRYKILGEKSALNRVFTNIIENILKHGEGDVKIGLKPEGESLIIEFSNKAESLDEISAKRIFEKFFTGDRMRTGQNTGLGLAIVKLLVEKMNGEISSEKVDDRLVIKLKFNRI
ncbi:sensor histidine kinase [Clostridium chrysemydis]|uniref:sensor histidine kinase n=1 Tax=Clostridium chrysemydis TaxID=2665504 RepID=UPI001883BFA4|nr:HAMP domain-containing sensor histidine kinase [Clostridium chrysemydis]